MNAEDYSISMFPQEDYRGAIVVLSVLFGAASFGYNGNNVPWYKRFEK